MTDNMKMVDQIMPPPDNDDEFIENDAEYIGFADPTIQCMPIPPGIYEDEPEDTEEIRERENYRTKEDVTVAVLFPSINQDRPDRKGTNFASHLYSIFGIDQNRKTTDKLQEHNKKTVHLDSRSYPLEHIHRDFDSKGKVKYTKLLVKFKSGKLNIIHGKKGTYIIILLSLICLASGEGNSEQWEIDKPIIFGKNTTLTLSIPTEMIGSVDGTKIWYGGPNNKLLAYKNVSSDVEKYDTNEFRNVIQYIFSLIIQNFNDTDLNCQYVFQNGLKQYSKNLTLKDSNVERHPNNNTIYYVLYIEDSWLLGNVSVGSVYPSPNCNFSYGEKLINKSEIIRREVNISNTSLAIQYSFNLSMKSIHYCHSLAMECLVGTFRMSENFIIQNCTETVLGNAHDKMSMLTGIIVALLVVLILLALAVGVYMYLVQKKSKQEQKKARDEAEMEMSEEILKEEEEKMDMSQEMLKTEEKY